jgi:hypothetical protein
MRELVTHEIEKVNGGNLWGAGVTAIVGVAAYVVGSTANGSSVTGYGVLGASAGAG